MTNDTAVRESEKKHTKLKAGLAIAAGAALLLGGGTTVAYWSTQASLGAVQIETGDLNLELTGTGTWELNGVIVANSTSGDLSDLGDVRIVPGDVLTLQQSMDVTVVGDTMEADLEVDTEGLVDPALAGAIDVDFAVQGQTESTPGVYRFDQSATGLQATVTVTFDAATPDREFVNSQINLDEVDFVLTQATS